MNYWLFIVTGHKNKEYTLSSEEIYNQRMNDKFWGLGERTPNRKYLKKGDRAVFYVGNPKMVFAGSAVLDSNFFQLKKTHINKYHHEKKFYHAEYGVLLCDVEIWEKPRIVKNILDELTFVENVSYWYTYFQGGIRQISESDFNTIISGVSIQLVDKIKNTLDLESQSEFALESHLEEFIYENWKNINWGRELSLFITDEQNGRQFPAGTWSIDFLAIDNETDELVIIELKKGKTSDAVVGQILRYMNWVKDNVAEPGQKVRGMIIVKDIDEALKYSIKYLNNIDVMNYKVDFKLTPIRR